MALLNPATQQTPSRCWWSCVEGRLHPATQIAPPLRQIGPLQLGVIFSLCHLVLVRDVNKLVALLLALHPVVLVALQKRERGVFLP